MVQRCEGCGSVAPGGGLLRSDQDTAGAEEVADGGAFGQEFGVGEDLEVGVGVVGGFVELDPLAGI